MHICRYLRWYTNTAECKAVHLFSGWSGLKKGEEEMKFQEAPTVKCQGSSWQISATKHTVSRLNFKLEKSSREYIAAVAWDPCGGPGQIWTETYGFMVAAKKGHSWCGMAAIYRVTWCRMLLFSAAPLHCIASCIHGLPYRGGWVSSISDSPISVTPPLKYLSLIHIWRCRRRG